MINIDKAFDALAKNEEIARELATELLPFPPAGLPSLKSIKGNGMNRAIVHGYTIAIEKTHHVLDENGKRKYPGEDGFLEAQQFRLMGEKNGYSAPAGWKIVNHEASSLPHRQLRKSCLVNACISFRSLPHRQLRNVPVVIVDSPNSSLPHRQLRKSFMRTNSTIDVFTAAQAA